MKSTPSRVKVGILTTPLAPFSAVKTLFHGARLIGADHFLLADHNKGLIPGAMWNRNTTSSARLSPNPDAFLDPTVTLARLAGRSRMSLGSGVTDPLRRSAADLARCWMTLHHATKGRAVLGLGSGEKQNNEAYGTSMTRSVAHLEETLQAVRLAWSSNGELVDFAGEWTKWNKARFALGPYRGTSPALWVAAQGPRMLRIAGQYGDGWIGPEEGLGPEVWAERAGKVAAAVRKAGKDVESYDYACFVVTVLAPDRRQLLEVMNHPVMRFVPLSFPDSTWQMAGLKHPLENAALGNADLDFDEIPIEDIVRASERASEDFFRTAFYVGTADEVATQLQPVIDFGAKHILLYDITAGAGIGAAARAQVETAKLIRRLRRATPGRVAIPLAEVAS
jgi:phthiodiolone/phenolphthiodiolone dimycocerosates ketoreductase